jgi:hypothetical protein
LVKLTVIGGIRPCASGRPEVTRLLSAVARDLAELAREERGIELDLRLAVEPERRAGSVDDAALRRARGGERQRVAALLREVDRCGIRSA